MIKNPLPANAGDIRDIGSIPGSGRSPGGGHGNPLQYSCLENPHGQRSLAGFSPYGCKESDMTKVTTYTYSLNSDQQFSTLSALELPVPRPHPGPIK